MHLHFLNQVQVHVHKKLKLRHNLHDIEVPLLRKDIDLFEEKIKRTFIGKMRGF